MKEHQLKFNRNEDPTLVEDVDGKLAKNINDIYSKIKMNLGFCHEQLVAGTLSQGMLNTHISLTEAYVVDFLKAVGYDGMLEAEKNERFKEIRELHEQNRALREQLGQKVTNEDFRERIKIMTKSIKEWWNIYGFGYVSEIVFVEYAVKIKLSGSITEAYYGRDSRDTVGTKLEYLTGLGFEMTDGEIYNKSVRATDENIEKLTNLLVNKFPSATIEEMVISPYSKSREIKEIEVYIRNLDDII